MNNNKLPNGNQQLYAPYDYNNGELIGEQEVPLNLLTSEEKVNELTTIINQQKQQLMNGDVD